MKIPNARLIFSKKELVQLSRENVKWTKLGDFYITKLIKKANELGLQGHEIHEIVGIDNIDGMECKNIDFILNEKH